MNNIHPITADDVLRYLDTLREVSVLIHRNPDGDAVGSGVALVRFLEGKGVKATLVSPDRIPERLRFLLEDTPLAEGVLDPAHPAVSVDVASPGQLGALGDELEKLPALISIDHHDKSTPFAPHLTVPEAAATGELLYSLLSQSGTEPLSPALAAPLYAAISSDTGCFRFSNVTPATHKAAAALLEFGINAALINQRLFDSKTPEELLATAYAIEKMQIGYDGRVAILPVDPEEYRPLGLSEGDFEAAIDTVRSRKGVEIAAVLRPRGEGELRLSLRTTGADAASFCAMFGGGGHKRAAGCALPGESLDEAVSLFFEKIGAFLE